MGVVHKVSKKASGGRGFQMGWLLEQASEARSARRNECSSFTNLFQLPFAVMDARTIDPSYITTYKNTINFGLFKFKNLAAGIAFEPDQKWYYYPFQTSSEVLIFHQYSKDKHLVNPHTSFFNRNCPEDTQERISVEFRLALFY